MLRHVVCDLVNNEMIQTNIQTLLTIMRQQIFFIAWYSLIREKVRGNTASKLFPATRNDNQNKMRQSRE